jgi:MFS family permease
MCSRWSAKKNIRMVIATVFLAGLLLGLGGRIAAGAMIYYTASGEAPESPAGVMAGSGMFGAGIGALTGYLADRSHKGTEVLYQAPRQDASSAKGSISR